MMKKLITAILAVIYLVTSTGATLRFHYCMGELVGWGFGSKEAAHCAGCGMSKKETDSKGCCKDQHKFFKNDSDQKTTDVSLQQLELPATGLPVAIIENPSSYFTFISEDYPVSNAPPRSHGIAVYILNRTFLI
jgi:hypothetical protein